MNRKYDGLEIAIIGMSGQFPGSANIRQLWANLREGRELITDYTTEQLIGSGVPKSQVENEGYVGRNATLRDKDQFDHAFFGYSPDEATFMDPQIRLFHQHCWKALEDAGYASQTSRQKTGLFAGASENYNWKLFVHARSGNARVDPFFLDILSSPKFLSTLVAYKLNLHGGAYLVDTACSTSLVAVHLACRSLLLNEMKIALAGGVSVATYPQKGYLYQEGMIRSVDGRCRAFDKDASGTVGGEGVGVVALKKLSEAIKDNDHIYCVIRGSFVNNDGSRKVGYTAPSVQGQAECIRLAHKMAGVDPRSIGYVEAHGTGTLLGDPVEVKALNEAFGGDREKHCAIGSVKTNMGHLDAAAGVAGLIKAALSLKYREIPKSLHFSTPNPEIDFDQGPFYVSPSLEKWQRPADVPLRAGVSSFGIGGTNAHIVLEEAPETQEDETGREFRILTLSARSESALRRYEQELKDFLLREVSINLADLAFTLQVGRQHFVYRRSLVFSEKQQLLPLLERAPGEGAGRYGEDGRPVVLLFPGQGAQYANMAKDLYLTEPVFREILDLGFRLIKEINGQCLDEMLFSTGEDAVAVNDTRYTQPLLFLVEYALGKLLLSYGVEPAMMLGHSIGEYVAACIGGVFTFGEALKLVVHRARLISDVDAGVMISVGISESDAGGYLRPGISLAAVNAPGQVVLSGDSGSMAALMEELDGAGLTYVKLRTSHAFHSGTLDDVAPAFAGVCGELTLCKPSYPYISNLTGQLAGSGEWGDPGYWVRHMRETVRFSDGIATILSLINDPVFLEVGPGHSLRSLLRQQGRKNVKYAGLMRAFNDSGKDTEWLARGLGDLWEYGALFDWGRYHTGEKRRRIPIPGYSFEPSRFPAEVDGLEGDVGKAYNRAAPTRGQELKDWIYYPVWKSGVPTAGGESARNYTYLFFSPGDPFSDALRAMLEKKGGKVIEVLAGASYRKVSEGEYYLQPGEPEQFTALLRDLRGECAGITDIIYAWCATAESASVAVRPDNEGLHRVYWSIVRMVQAFLQEGAVSGKMLTVLTHSLNPITGGEAIAYAQAMALGLVNTVPQEYGMTCRAIDVDMHGMTQACLHSLTEEIVQRESRERVVAIRHGKRWVKEFQRNTYSLKRGEKILKEGGVYLITGGLGNVGFVLAKFLIATCGAKVMLTGRRSIGSIAPGEEWIRRLEILRGMSPDVKYFMADVTHKEAMDKVVREIETSTGRICGVIHAAGDVSRGHFEWAEDMTYAHAAAVFDAKLSGIRNLAELFASAGLDFLVATSSLSTVLGGLGFGAYAAANLFMEYFITACTGQNPRWKCLALAEMLFREEEGSREDDRNRTALKAEEICRLFEWSLSLDHTPVILETTGDLAERLHRAYATNDPGEGSSHIAEAMPSERPDLRNAYVAAETEIERTLIVLLEDLFGIRNIGVTDNFFDLGGDSLKAMMLLKRINKEFSVNLTLKHFFGLGTIRQMAGEIEEMTWFNKKPEHRSVVII